MVKLIMNLGQLTTVENEKVVNKSSDSSAVLIFTTYDFRRLVQLGYAT